MTQSYNPTTVQCQQHDHAGDDGAHLAVQWEPWWRAQSVHQGRWRPHCCRRRPQRCPCGCPAASHLLPTASPTPAVRFASLPSPVTTPSLPLLQALPAQQSLPVCPRQHACCVQSHARSSRLPSAPMSLLARCLLSHTDLRAELCHAQASAGAGVLAARGSQYAVAGALLETGLRTCCLIHSAGLRVCLMARQRDSGRHSSGALARRWTLCAAAAAVMPACFGRLHQLATAAPELGWLHCQEGRQHWGQTAVTAPARSHRGRPLARGCQDGFQLLQHVHRLPATRCTRRSQLPVQASRSQSVRARHHRSGLAAAESAHWTLLRARICAVRRRATAQARPSMRPAATELPLPTACAVTRCCALQGALQEASMQGLDQRRAGRCWQQPAGLRETV